MVSVAALTLLRHWRVAVVVVMALGLVAALLWARSLRDDLTHVRAEKAALERSLALYRANSALAMRLAARNAERERERGAKVAKLEEEVRRARKPVPAECRPVLDPIRRALAGVRDLQRGGGGAAPGPDVPPGPPGPGGG